MRSDRLSGLKTLVGFCVAAGILVAAGAYAARGSWPWREQPQLPMVSLPQLLSETVDTLRRGETISDLFVRQGLPGFTLSEGASLVSFNPRRLRPGMVFTFQRLGDASIPTTVLVRTTADERVALHLASDGWNPIAEPIPWQSEKVALEGDIVSSLYDALDEGVADSLLSAEDRVRLAWDLADIFAWQVDFGRDIRPGDGFRVLVERLVSEEGEVRYGQVLAADLTIGGNRYTGVRFTLADGSSGFFDAEGRSLRRAFLLAPVQFRRISSSLSSARLHPILGTVRKHEGTDYTADPGTPVMAAGDGIVARREWSGGYGNLIELHHANGIVTRYGHLQSFARGLTGGQRVRQGEVIGYVGSTGLATGPHLHYEFRVNGVSRDPRATDLGSGEPVPLAQERDFAAERAHLLALLAWPQGIVPNLAATAPPPPTATN